MKQKPSLHHISPQHETAHGMLAQLPPVAIKLEKISQAAKRMCLSLSGTYREANAGNITLIKLGVRSSAVVSESVDAWIAARVAAAQAKKA